ncbi:MAG TPA: AarF/UbiB family protein [Acidimicrobiales bacterium]|nr:AarF/UbiB family protein [Acidimicrobiales bacterium]
MATPTNTSLPGAGVPPVHARRLPEPDRRVLVRRGIEITRILSSELAPLALRQARELHRGRLPPSAAARPLRHSAQRLGGTFLKFGQMVASSPGLFGEDVADEFRSCLDTGPPVPFPEVRLRVEDDLGCSLEEAYAEFDPDPIGRASIAVVYRGRLHDGREVAVKVLRPDIETLVATDLDLMQPLVDIISRMTGDQTAGSTLQLLDGLRQQLGEELDLRNEARALEHFRRLAAQIDAPLVAVPEPYPELSGPNVLAMELLHGAPIDDLARAEDLGYDPAPLVEQVVRSFFVTTVRWGVFHGDIHAGNMLLLDDGRIGVIDWGIVGRLDEDTHTFLIRLLQGALGDESAWPDITAYLTKIYGRAIQEGLGMTDEELTVFIRNLIEPTLTRPFGEVSLAALVEAPQIQAARAAGVTAHERSVRSILRRLRAQRRMRRLADESGGLMSDFDRGAFLLGKQLMYFERYGKMFLADVPLMHDREFLASLLAGAPGREEGRDLGVGEQN